MNGKFLCYRSYSLKNDQETINSARVRKRMSATVDQLHTMPVPSEHVPKCSIKNEREERVVKRAYGNCWGTNYIHMLGRGSFLTSHYGVSVRGPGAAAGPLNLKRVSSPDLWWRMADLSASPPPPIPFLNISSFSPSQHVLSDTDRNRAAFTLIRQPHPFL